MLWREHLYWNSSPLKSSIYCGLLEEENNMVACVAHSHERHTGMVSTLASCCMQEQERTGLLLTPLWWKEECIISCMSATFHNCAQWCEWVCGCEHVCKFYLSSFQSFSGPDGISPTHHSLTRETHNCRSDSFSTTSQQGKAARWTLGSTGEDLYKTTLTEEGRGEQVKDRTAVSWRSPLQCYSGIAVCASFSNWRGRFINLLLPSWVAIVRPAFSDGIAFPIHKATRSRQQRKLPVVTHKSSWTIQAV